MGALGAPIVEAPLITALHVVAVREIDEGHRPTLRRTVAAGVVTLPLVAPVVILYTLGIIGGLVLLVIPGIVLAVRWLVAAPAVVIEGVRGPAALARSRDLTSGFFWRGFAVLVVPIALGVLIDPLVPNAGRHLTIGSANFLGGLARETLVQSLAALSATLLYFSLRTREAVST